MKRRGASPSSLWELAAEGWVLSLAPLAMWAWHAASSLPTALMEGLRPLPDWLWLAVLWAGPTWIALRLSATGERLPLPSPVERAYGCGVRLAVLAGLSATLALAGILAARHASAGPEPVPLPARLLPALVDALVLTVPLSGALALAWGGYAAWVTRALVLSRWPALAAPDRQRGSRRRPFASAWQRCWLALQHDPGLAHRFLGHPGRGVLWNTGWHLLAPLALVATSGLALAALRSGVTLAPSLALGITASSLGGAVLLHVGYALLAAADLALAGSLPQPVPAAPATVTITPMEQSARQSLPALAAEPTRERAGVPSTVQPDDPAAA